MCLAPVTVPSRWRAPRVLRGARGAPSRRAVRPWLLTRSVVANSLRRYKVEVTRATPAGPSARARSCTWPLRVNISDFPCDRYRDKKLWTRGLLWHPSGPLPPGDGRDSSRADTRRPLRPPPLTASHHRGMLTPCWLRPRRDAKEQHLTQRPDMVGEARRPWRACTAATAWLSRSRGWIRAVAGAGVRSRGANRNYSSNGRQPPAAAARLRPCTAY